MNIWKSPVEFDYKLYNEVESFFDNLHSSKIHEYREGQVLMALDVLDALKNKEMLLIEAGVGIGKSWGYLIPLLYACKDKEKFQGFLISTSSIALQNQLVEEIAKLSKMLDIDIPVTVAKGKTNFICKKRLENYLKNHKNNEYLLSIKTKVDKGIIDKEEYPDIAASIFKNININHVNCSNCLYKNNCAYTLNRKKWKEAKYVICNHDLLIESLKRDNHDLILKDPSLLVIDEAHNLEAKIRNSYQGKIDKDKLEALILKISFIINEDIETYQDSSIITSLNKVFRMISTKAKYKYNKNAKENIEFFDEETSGFDLSNKLKEEIASLINYLEELINEVNCYQYLDNRLLNYLSKLKEYKNIFNDLIDSKSKNIYWVTFIPNTKNHIVLEYVRKDIYKESAKLLSSKNYGKVFTSATMTTSGDYNYFVNNLGLNEINGISLLKEFPQVSPYNYQENALLYLADDVISPKSMDRSLYLDSLAKKINTLINITEGKSLVLFTSKKDMLEVYNRIIKEYHDFNIMVQKDHINADDLKVAFRDDLTSVLFATGVFFEGIDIKGESLENVIIAKLPFPVVDPIIEEKSSYYKDGFKEVYLKEMLIKLKQGTGRLIRSSTDKGIVSILDPRYREYKEEILSSLPFTNITTDIDDVLAFANNKLGIVKVKK